MNTCPPMLIYIALVTAGLVRTLFIQSGPVALKGVAIVFTLVGATVISLLLRYLCNTGNEMIAWVIVFVTFIFGVISLLKKPTTTSKHQRKR